MTGTEQWLGGAVVIGLFTACWGKIKLVAWRLINLVIVKVRVENEIGTALAFHCWHNFKRSPFGERRFSAVNEFVQPIDRYQIIGYEQIGQDPTMFWQGWRPLILNFDKPNNAEGGFGMALTAVYIRGIFNLDKLLIEALDKLNEFRHTGECGNRFKVIRSYGNGSMRSVKSKKGDYIESDNSVVKENNNPDKRFLKWQLSEIGMSRDEGNSFGILSFPKEVLKVVEHCKRWLNSEHWYKEKEINWRLGILLHGKPGCGKTSLVKALGRELNLPVTSFDLASYGNQDFEHSWQKTLNQTPCIALLEDIDAVFDGRENRLGKEGGGLTFDCLLNCIGGIKDASGVLVFVTTNRPECLDNALGKYDEERGVSTRPGRIDVVVELSPLDYDCRRSLANRILSDCPWLIDQLVIEGNGDTGAQFSERCSKIALDYYWNELANKIPIEQKQPQTIKNSKLAR